MIKMNLEKRTLSWKQKAARVAGAIAMPFIFSKFAKTAKADLPIYPICTNSAPQSNPNIYGDLVVWEDERNNSNGYNRDIYAIDLNGIINNGIEFPIVNDSKDQTNPYVFENKVIWLEDGEKIKGYDLEKKSTFTVTSRSPTIWNNSSNNFSDNTVVWQEGLGDTVAKNLLTETQFIVSSSPYTIQDSQAVSGSLGVWRDYRNGYQLHETDIYGRDFNNNEEIPICTHLASQEDPAVSGNIVVWADNRNGKVEDTSYFNNWDIYGSNIETREEFPICTANGAQKKPSISGNNVVWENFDYTPGKNYFSVWGHNLSSKETFPIATPSINNDFLSCYSPSIHNDKITFVGETHSGDTNIYMTEIPKLADLNKDGKIDMNDFAIFASQWNGKER